MRGRVEAVLLDMGGVVIPELPGGYERAADEPGLLEALAALGVGDPAGAIRDAAGRVREAYRALEPECTQPDLDSALGGLPPEARRLLLAAFGRVAAHPPYSFAREVVAELARRWPLGLVSNTSIPGEHHARSLARAGVLQHFRAAAWSANFGRRKPDPAILHHVLGRLGVPPERAMLAGDKLRTDVEAARRAGVRSIWIRWGERIPDDGARPDFVVADPRGLPALLRRLG